MFEKNVKRFKGSTVMQALHIEALVGEKAHLRTKQH